MENLDNLYESEKDTLLRFFLNKMNVGVRQQLMATYPQHYALLYPGVDVKVTVNLVSGTMTDLSGFTNRLPKYERKPL